MDKLPKINQQTVEFVELPFSVRATKAVTKGAAVGTAIGIATLNPLIGLGAGAVYATGDLLLRPVAEKLSRKSK